MKPLIVKNKLCTQLASPPKYFVSVKSKKGTQLKLADPMMTRSALALMCMQAVLGGAASHWGGPCAFVEIVSALYGLIFNIANHNNQAWHKLFHIINDAGHCENGIYAVRANYGLGGLSFQDLKGFRSIHSRLTGHGEAHLFPEGVYLSNGPLGSTLAQAEGLCMADRLQGNLRTTCVLISDGACMEGEAKEALASIAGLAQKNKMNPFVLIVSDNNTKLSGRIDQDSFSMNPTFQSLSVLGWQVLDLPQAHQLTACVDQIEEALSLANTSSSRPVCILAKTVKGYGVKATETSKHGGHGFPLKDPSQLSGFLKEICGSKQLPEELVVWHEELIAKPSYSVVNPAVKKTKVQKGIGRALVQAGDKNWPVVSISADLQGSTGVLPFRNKFPDRSFEVGVAEANMISAAAGFSKQGFIPVVDTFTQFGVTKGALPLLMANLSGAPVIALFSHAGLQDAADGASHQSLTYLAQTASLPLTDVYCLTSAAEAFALVLQAIESFNTAYQKNKTPRTKIFFFGREIFPDSYFPENYVYQLGRAQIVFSHSASSRPKAVSIVAAGPMLESAILAGQELAVQNWTVRIINPSIINHPDIKTIQACLKETNGRLLTVEDHYLIGGMGSLLSHQLIIQRLKVDIQSLAVRSVFGRSAYQSAHLYKQEKLTAKDIVESVLSKWS